MTREMTRREGDAVTRREKDSKINGPFFSASPRSLCRRVSSYCEAGASLEESLVDSPAAGGDDTVLT